MDNLQIMVEKEEVVDQVELLHHNTEVVVVEEAEVLEGEVEEGVVVEELEEEGLAVGEEEMMKVWDPLRTAYLVYLVKTILFMLMFQILAFPVMDR